MTQQQFLPSKPRYEILDGLRGVAALVVILFHLMETYRVSFATQFVNHGYLAVDFFFVLSGFVTGYAYDDRWGKMSTWEFFKRRLTRLHPMVAFSVLIGAAFYFFQGYTTPAAMARNGWLLFLLCMVLDLFMIPQGPGVDVRGWGEITSFNGPRWSLMFEYIGNILYAVIFRRLPKAALAVLLACSAFFTMDLALGINIFGILPDGKYNLIGGWIRNPEHMYTGFVRLLYPYLCGLLIARILPSRVSASNPSGSPLHMRNGFWWCSLAIIVILFMPCVGGKVGFADGLYQCLIVWFAFPAIVLIGAGSVITSERTAKLCKFLGDLSYPLYITHYPVVMMQFKWVKRNADAPLWMHIGVVIAIYFISIIIAYGAFKLYDEPVRNWLKKHWLKH